MVIPDLSKFLLLTNKQVIIKWRGKPVFIRHRTEDEIQTAKNTDWQKLRDPESDEDRAKKPEWLIMLGRLIPSKKISEYLIFKI